MLSRCHGSDAWRFGFTGGASPQSSRKRRRRFFQTCAKSLSSDDDLQDGSSKRQQRNHPNATTGTLNFRYDHSVDLAPTWILALRSDLPVLAKNSVTSSNPNGDYLAGVGDANIQAAIIHNLSPRFAVGFGARLITPTGGETFGSEKWQVMPIVGARYALWEINSSSYFEPLFRYDASFAGDPTRRNISNLQIAPAFNIGLPDQWFITFYPSPDIRINFGDPITGQTGRFFLPFDFRVGRKLQENAALSFELGVPIIKDYPVYNLKTQARFNLTF